MRVSADKKFRRTSHEAADDGRVVLARITADMLDQDLGSIYRETVYLAETSSVFPARLWFP